METTAPPPVPSLPQPKTSGLAIASLICGLAGFLTAGLSGIAAIITGHMALSAIKRSGGMLGGTGMSIAGLVTGYLTVLILPIAILAGLAAPVIMKQKQAADRSESIGNVRAVGLAFFDFDTEYGSTPSNELAAEIPEFAGLTGPRVLEQLEVGGFTKDVEKRLSLRKVEPGDCWYYFPRVTSGDPDLPLLISPPVGGKLIVLQLDSTARAMDPAELSTMDLSTAIKIPATRRK